MSDEQLIKELRKFGIDQAADRIEQLTAERDAALAEVERLREGLREIEDMDTDWTSGPDGNLQHARDKASELLQENTND